MKKVNLWGILLLPLLLAQAATLDLRLSRDWGYGGMNGRIQGRFSLHASGPDDLVEVRFRMDGAVINVDAEPPFRYQFDTGSFDPGRHEMSATGLLPDGAELQSAAIVRTFLTEEEAGQETAGLVVPLLLVVGVITLLGVGGPLLLGRRRQHRPGVYGASGGAVCPRCMMPFSRNVLSPNLLVGKLERCPHCGKWSIAPRANAAALEAAEKRLAGEGEVQAFESEEEKQRRLLDDSRFDG